MSILIKGMKMPKTCNECLMSIEQACMINGNIISDYWARLERPTDCPLLEVPPHGDLVNSSDIEKLINTIYDRYDYGIISLDTFLKYMLQVPKTAPVIIEAEEGEKP